MNRANVASSPPTYDTHMQRMKAQAPQPGASGEQTYAQVRKKWSHWIWWNSWSDQDLKQCPSQSFMEH